MLVSRMILNNMVDSKSGGTKLLAMVSGLLLSLAACSSAKSEFSDAKVSAESQQYFNMYEKLKDDPGFKEQLNTTMSRKPDYHLDKSLEVTANGTVYKDANEIFKRNSKTLNRGFNGSYAEFLKKHGAGVGNIEVKDFQLADDIMADSLRANGSKEALDALLKKYSLVDFVKAARAKLIIATYHNFSASKPSTGLNLQGGAEAVAKPLGDVVVAGIDAAAKAGERGANENIKNACADAVKACMDSATEIDTKIYYQCISNTNDPNIPLNNNTARENMASTEGIAIKSHSSYVGTLGCSKHFWYMWCSEGNKKKGNGDYWWSDKDSEGCSWVHDDEKSPKKPGEDPNQVLKQRASCEAQKGCNININLGNT